MVSGVFCSNSLTLSTSDVVINECCRCMSVSSITTGSVDIHGSLAFGHLVLMDIQVMFVDWVDNPLVC